jgi:hypothetical protein
VVLKAFDFGLRTVSVTSGMTTPLVRNDEVERRGVASTQNKGSFYPDHRLPRWLTD